MTKIVVLLLTAAMLFSGCGGEKTLKTHSDTQNGSTDNISFEETQNETDHVKLEMMDGGIVLIELYPDTAPITVANFKKLVS